MEYYIIPIVSFLASALTLLSGFGLGMILSAALFLFFPLDTAVALTAIVHLANNILKFKLFRSYFDKEIILKFGIPAILFSLLGAYLLSFVSNLNDPVQLFSFHFLPLNVLLGCLMIIFAFYKPNPKKVEHPNYLTSGGILSGFFGGLAGHQGGIRSAFLSKLDIDKNVFIGSGVAIACLIDFSRIPVYFINGKLNPAGENLDLLFLAILFAFLGVFFGKKLMEKTTYSLIQWIVKILLTIQGIYIIFNLSEYFNK